MREMKKSPLEMFGGHKLQLFTDLSPTTLARRRALRPLTTILQAKNINYRWGFPIILTVNHQGTTVRLRSQDEVQEFCDKLGLQRIKIENWEIELPKWKTLENSTWNKN